MHAYVCIYLYIYLSIYIYITVESITFAFLDYAFILREAIKKIKGYWLVKTDIKFNAECPIHDFNPAHSMCVMFLHYTVIQ